MTFNVQTDNRWRFSLGCIFRQLIVSFINWNQTLNCNCYKKFLQLNGLEVPLIYWLFMFYEIFVKLLFFQNWLMVLIFLKKSWWQYWIYTDRNLEQNWILGSNFMKCLWKGGRFFRSPWFSIDQYYCVTILLMVFSFQICSDLLHTVSFDWFLSGVEWILNLKFC